MVWRVGAGTGLPIADDQHPWTPADASSRVFALAKEGDHDLDQEIARKAFLFYDSDQEDSQWQYLLQIADVIDGKISAIPEAIREAYRNLNGTSINPWDQITDIPPEVIKEARGVLDKYFEFMHSREHLIAQREKLDGSTIQLRIDRSIKFSLKEKSDGVLLATLTPQGFLRVEPSRLARDGTLVYSDGREEWNEFRSAEELVKAARSFDLVPLTWDHPPEMLTSSNVRHWQCGSVGTVTVENVDGVTYLVGSVLITDPGLIRAAQDGECCELSIGFLARVWEKSGVAPDGLSFKFLQTDLEGNHVAAVEEGRAGPICRLSAVGDAWQQGRDEMTIARSRKTDQEILPPAPAVPAAAAPAPVAPVAAPPAEAAPAAAAPAPELETLDIPGLGPVQLSKTLAMTLRAIMAMIQGNPAAPAEAATGEESKDAAHPPEEEGDKKDEEEDGKDKDDKDKKDKDDEDAKDKKDSAELQRLRGIVDGLTQSRESEAARFDARHRLLNDAARILGPETVLDGKSPSQVQMLVIARVEGLDAADAKQLMAQDASYIAGRYHAAVGSFVKSAADSVAVADDPFEYVGDIVGGDKPLSLVAVMDQSNAKMRDAHKSHKAS